MKEDTTIDQTTELELKEDAGKTQLIIRAEIRHAGPQAQMAVEGMQAGFSQQLEKLDHFLQLRS
jgi:hypothetical protein